MVERGGAGTPITHPKRIRNNNTTTLKLNQKNPGLLMVFMGGWTKHTLENPSHTDPLKLNTAGVQTVLNLLISV
jgi:hypothetical protein